MMHISMRISLFSLALIVYLAGSAGAQNYPEGDLNKDYKIDFVDLQALTDYWLDVNCVAPACEADLDDIPGVNMYDFARLAGNWFKDYSEITLTIDVNGSGSVNKDPNKATYHYGEDVNLTAIPATGWQFSSWSGDLSGSANPKTITMNGHKTVTATFTQIEYTLTIDVNGSGSVNKNPNKATYHYGEDVNLTAIPATGWQFSSWSGDLSGSANPKTITMNGHKTVTATFTQIEYTLTIDVNGSGSVNKDPNKATYHYGEDVNLTAIPATGWQFSSWSGDLSGSANPKTITMNGHKTVTATFTQIEYTLTIDVNGSGSVNKNPNKATYHYGEDVNLTAIPATGWQFSSWSGDLSGSANPKTITMNGHKTVTATFTQIEYTLTIDVNGSGSVNKDPNKATYHYGEDVNLTAIPATGWQFSSWSGDLSGSANPKTITMNGHKTVTATFTQIEYTLTIDVNGSGSVNKNPNKATYHYGEDVNLTAIPATGWQFSSWSGDLSGSANPKTITMNGHKTVTATFTQIEYTTLVINEFMAKNNSDSGIRDEWGNYDDWIEIHNYGNEAINIAGMHLTDNPVDQPLPWWDVPSDNPSATTIPAGGYLLIWADEQQSQGTLHTSFALSGSGEQIGLYDADENLIDSITFGSQEQNKSYGRLPDGSDNWQILDNPTPGKSNGIPPSSIIISEIMYHPYHNVLTYEPENLGQEYIELFNRGTGAVNLSGWRFSNGVDFNFPEVTIPAGQRLVVAADVNIFKAKYPGVNNVVGGWTGKLRNKGEKIELADEDGMIIDRVKYADEGDWAVRELGPVDNYHRGWVWSDAHDGAGKSLELINPAMPNEYGRNWAASNVNGGTPGTLNSVNANNIAPLILDVEHSPIIPGPNNPVTVTARIIDELPTGITATLHYSVDNSVYTSESVYPQFNPADYNNLSMFDDGAHGDGAASDGIYGAQIPAHANGIIIEFFVKAQDSGANTRTWPPPSLMDGTPKQVTNVLYQVNGSFDPNADWIAGARPIFYLIMTEMERGRLADIGNEQAGDNDERHSRAQMNGTFISIDGVDMKKRYTVSIRNRGESNSGVPPNNYRVNFRHDDPWKEITSININSKYTYLQVAGYAIFRKAGLLAPEASPVEARVNSTNLALTDPCRMYGAYNYLEVYDSDWAENHIPDDSGGNLYKAAHYPASATLDYLGTNPADYVNAGYTKMTNQSENDWTDLFELTNVLDNEPDATYVEEVNRVLNVRQWLRWFAVHALIGNNETCLGTGMGDDYRMYRGLIDTRFYLLFHDPDTILYVGEDIPPIDRSIFYAADRTPLPVIVRFLKHPVFVRQYYAEILDLIETTFSAEKFNPMLDQLLADWVPQSLLNTMKQKVAERITNVMQQIPLTFSISSSLTISNGFPRTTTSSTSLYGKANAIETASVLVNGQLATWTPVDGNWVGPTITLKPGINRVIVRTFDGPNGTGNEMEQGYIDIWYDDSTTSTISGTLSTSRILDAASGPWNVTGDVVVPSGITLTIQPGTTLYFNSGTGITVNTGGQLVAEGTQYQRIRMTRAPGTSNTWDGLKFNSTLTDNRLSYVDQEYGAGQGQAINALYSRITIDNMSWAGITNSFIYMEHPYTTISNNYFPSLSGSEPVHGIELTGNEYLILQGNVFAEGGTEDILDWDGTDSNKISFFALDNIFLGGGDDGLDLDGTDAYIEGNIFMNFHTADPCTTTSNGIAGGKSYHANTNLPDWTVVRNIFVNNDHGILAKEGAFATVLNNVFVDSNDAAIQFCENGRSVTGPGSGAYINGNIFWKYIRPLKYLIRESDLDPATGWPSDPNVTVNNSIITDENYPGSDNVLGSGNIDADPLFVDEQGDFHLKFMSPAIGTGPCGLDMGVYIPGGAAICGEPDEITYHTNATLTVGGPAITHYKYSINGTSSWSGELSVDVPIALTSLQNGQSYTVYVKGKNSAGLWQSDPCYAASRTWMVDTAYSRLVINEVLAHTHGNEPDLIELYYDGPAPINLTDMSLTDDPCLPRKFVFSSQTVTATIMNPGDYMVLYGDLQTQLKNHLGFALSADGEGLYLYDKPANGGGLIDSVVFGPQINDYSIGRVGYGGVWKLNKLTLGYANEFQPLGDPDTLKINEWLANEEVLFDEDFIELYNPCPLPVDLSELYLTDKPITQPAKQKLGPLSFVPANGYAVFVADDVNAPGHLDFKLSADRGMIGLFDAELNEIDNVLYCSQTTDVSQGRSPDGADNFRFFALPTPYIANLATTTTITDKTFVAGDASKRVKVPTAAVNDYWRGGGTFDDSTWTLVTSSPGGIGYDRATGSGGNYIPYISYNVESLMYSTGKNNTCYIRIPFTVDAADLGDVTSMTLKMRYDDGFVAYINGTEVYRRYFTGAPLWNSKANTDRTTDCSPPESFDISGYANTLHAGSNILAIHGLNYALTNSDFLITAELLATVTDVNEEFPDPEILDLLDGLRITELMYHDEDGSEFDFLELYNISGTTLDLDGVRLAGGIDFTFPNMTLAAGQYVVVVSDTTAFWSKYGTGANIAGEYSGNLSNGGEDIILQLPWPYEAAILRFEYDDSWYPSTDGLGDSLVIRDPYAHPATWDEAESWQAALPSP